MNFRLPEAKEVLILSPHPDDEALGCSGTILQLTQSGVSSTIVFLTNGENLYGGSSADITDKRRQEALNSSEILGCKEALFLNFPDGEINRHTEKISKELYRIIENKRPDIIFSPSPVDYHADHIATSHIAMGLLKTFRTLKLAFYEIYSTVRFNYLIDITRVVEAKKRAILNYTASLYGKPEVYINSALGLNAQRSIFTQEEGYYEAFYIIKKGEDVNKIHDYLCYK